uniref:Ion transport protein, putative n=1 Tax=Theileria annulata TaxID=5874 RepID=A0A3B0MPI8_THEAN
MISSNYFKFITFLDELTGALITVFIIFSTIRTCIRLPFSPLYSIAIQASITFISFLLINFNSIIIFLNKFFIVSYKSKGRLHTSRFINDRRRRLGKPQFHTHFKYSVSKKQSIQKNSKSSQPSDLEDSEQIQSDNSIGLGSSQYSFAHKSSLLHSLTLRTDRPFIKYGSDDIGYKDKTLMTIGGRVFNVRGSISEDHPKEPKFDRFVKCFRAWFKLHLVKTVLISKIWVVSSLLITLSWFAVWEWAAIYMHRDENDHNLLHWRMDSVPREYWHLESAFQIIFGITYIMNLYVYPSRFKYIFSFYGLIDLTMTPAITEIIILVSYYHLHNDGKQIRNFGLLFFGSLRFLRLFQTEYFISRSFTWISEFYTVFIGITASIMALILSFSGLLFLLEAPKNDINFSKPFDFIYFSVATMATVGYGDFSPVTLAGRILCVLFIVLCVTIAATQFKRIKLSTTENTHKIGTGKINEEYVFFWGAISDWQLLTFCKCVYNTYQTSIANIVVASPLPLKYYETVYMAVTQNTGIKLIIFGGSSTFNTPSYISKLLFNSKHTVLVNDMDANLSPNFNEYIINDDRRTILIGMATLNISKPLGIPLSIQLHGSEYKKLMSKSEFEDVFYNRDLKYRMFSSSVYCRGLFYLVSSLFHSPTNISRSKVHVEEMCNLFLLSEQLNQVPQTINRALNNSESVEISVYNIQRQMDELFRGMMFQAFKMKFPKSAHGSTFQEFGEYLYTERNIFLIGIVLMDNECVLNPVQYIIGEDYENCCALVIAESLNDVISASTAKYNPEERGIKESRVLTNSVRSKTISQLSFIREVGSLGDLVRYRGIYSVHSYFYAQENIFENHQFVLVCGWPYDLRVFLSYLLKDNNYNVVILAPRESVEEEDPWTLEMYSNKVAYMDGSPMDITDLTNAGIKEASCVIVFNFHHTRDKGRRENLSKDSQVLFVNRLLHEIMDDEKEIKSMLNIILDVSHASCLEYVDPSLIVNVDVTSKDYVQNKCWENYGEFMSSYEIASGCIFVQDMFYSILAHSNSKSEYSVVHKSVESMLDGGRLETEDYKISGGKITLENVPITFYSRNFGNLFKYYLSVEQKICVGILRTYQIPFANNDLKQFIIVAPQRYLVIHPNDQVYVVTRSQVLV